nr:aspartate aminotransferase family protein [Nanoarchaeota archaeon]
MRHNIPIDKKEKKCIEKQDMSKIYSKYEPDTMKDTFPLKWARAKDWFVWDDKGNKYIDFTSGIFVTNIGHSNEHVKKRIKEQLDNELWFAFAFPTDIRRKFIDKIIEITPDYLEKCAVFCEGSIAVESAIKLAREYTGKNKIISFIGCYHGSTTEINKLNGPKGLLPFPLDNERSFYKDIKEVMQKENCTATDIAAIIFEGYQGWAAYFYPKKYILELEKWCKENKVLMICDEIQSGFKRTGKLFCHQHYNIKPDLVICGKGISSSLPLSAVIGRGDVMSALDGKSLISGTHSGNTLCMAAGLANLEELEKLDENEILRKGEVMMNYLRKLKEEFPNEITLVTGKGLLSAIHFKDYDYCDDVTMKCIGNGLMIVRTRKGTIKIGPPLNISKKDLLNGLEIIRKNIIEVNEKNKA